MELVDDPSKYVSSVLRVLASNEIVSVEYRQEPPTVSLNEVV